MSIEINEVVFVGNRACGKGVIWKPGTSKEHPGTKTCSQDAGRYLDFQEAQSSLELSSSGMLISENQIKNCSCNSLCF